MTPLRPKIIGHETQLNNKIVYILQVVNQKTNKSKITKLRYSEFKDIHEEIVKLINKLKLNIVLPEFPSRKIFGSTNKSQELIFERKNDLTEYLTNLLTIQKIYCLEIIKKYFIPDETEQKKTVNQLNMQICIDRYTVVEDVVIYYIRLRDLNTHEEWTFKSRYSELNNVHNALQQSKIKNLPKFPSKKIFGITNQSPQEIQRRRKELQKYFNEIFSVREIINSQAINFFIEQSKMQAQKDKQIQALRKKNRERNDVN